MLTSLPIDLLAQTSGSPGIGTAGFHLPAPIWPADGNIPESEKNQYVFLSPDAEMVIIALPREADGNEPRKILNLGC
jgi:hypothetical protein